MNPEVESGAHPKGTFLGHPENPPKKLDAKWRVTGLDADKSEPTLRPNKDV